MDSQKSTILKLFICLVLILLMASCTGGDNGGVEEDGALASAPISAATGGTVTIEPPHPLAGTSIEVPAGALAEDTTISIEEVALPTNSGVVGLAIDIEPDGIVFNVPVTVTIVYDEADLPAERRRTPCSSPKSRLTGLYPPSPT